MSRRKTAGSAKMSQMRAVHDGHAHPGEHSYEPDRMNISPSPSISWHLSPDKVQTTDEKKIQESLDYIFNYYLVDGLHHKNWVVDQVVRTLLNDPDKYKNFVNDQNEYDSEGHFVANQWADMVQDHCIPP